MARTGKGILDGFRGSIGQTTGSRDKGKDVIRTKPRNTPKTQTPGLIKSKSNFQKWRDLYGWWDYIEIINSLKRLSKNKTEINTFYQNISKITHANTGWRKISILGGKRNTGKYFTTNFGQDATHTYHTLHYDLSRRPVNLPPGAYLQGFWLRFEGDTLLYKGKLTYNINGNGGRTLQYNKSWSCEIYYMISIFNANHEEIFETTICRIGPGGQTNVPA